MIVTGILLAIIPFLKPCSCRLSLKEWRGKKKKTRFIVKWSNNLVGGTNLQMEEQCNEWKKELISLCHPLQMMMVYLSKISSVSLALNPTLSSMPWHLAVASYGVLYNTNGNDEIFLTFIRLSSCPCQLAGWEMQPSNKWSGCSQLPVKSPYTYKSWKKWRHVFYLGN